MTHHAFPTVEDILQRLQGDHQMLLLELCLLEQLEASVRQRVTRLQKRMDALVTVSPRLRGKELTA